MDLPVMITDAPSEDTTIANVSPIPEEAPVIKILLSLKKFKGIMFFIPNLGVVFSRVT
jgi:hypothetical protein